MPEVWTQSPRISQLSAGRTPNNSRDRWGFFLTAGYSDGNPNIIQHMILARVTPDLQIPRPGIGTGTDTAAIHGRATIAF